MYTLLSSFLFEKHKTKQQNKILGPKKKIFFFWFYKTKMVLRHGDLQITINFSETHKKRVYNIVLLLLNIR